jgi:hypothetical protein
MGWVQDNPSLDAAPFTLHGPHYQMPLLPKTS